MNVIGHCNLWPKPLLTSVNSTKQRGFCLSSRIHIS